MCLASSAGPLPSIAGLFAKTKSCMAQECSMAYVFSVPVPAVTTSSKMSCVHLQMAFTTYSRLHVP